MESEPLPSEFELARRVWALAALLLVLSGACLFAAADEPFWCLLLRDVVELLVLPGLIVGGWLGLFVLSWHGRRQRGLGATLLLLPLLAGPSLFVALSCVRAYLDDLARSPSLRCSGLPDYGSCAANGSGGC